MSIQASDISVTSENLIIEDEEINELNDDYIDTGEDSDENEEDAMGQPSEENGKSLFKQAFDKNMRSEDIVAAWIARYKNNSNDAFVAFMQFVIEASGSHYKLPQETKLTSDYTDILIAGTAQFCNKSVFYPLTKKTASRFLAIVENFLKCFFGAIDCTPIINDNVFLGHVTGFIMACSQSKVRAFRHTSTMIGLKILTILMNLTNIEYEKLKSLWQKMFQCVFLMRSRDVVDDIRYLCLVEYYEWLKSYPNCFLKPQDIEYIFQALRDECGKVRECSLMALNQLYAMRVLRESCLQEGKKFINDLVAIALDNENELGEHAINLLEKFSMSSSNMLDESQYLLIEQLIFAANRGLAKAAAKMFQRRRLTDENLAPSSHIRTMIDFFHEFGQHEHAAYLVDAFFDVNVCILDWSTMVEMLTQKELDEATASTLIEILRRGVEQAITGEIPAGRYTKTLLRKSKAQAQDLVTSILAPVMSQLLAHHSNHCQNLVNLLELPQHFNIAHYQTTDENRGQLAQLLASIKQIMFQNENILVLRTAAAALEYAYQLPSTTVHSEELFKRAINNYETAYQSWKNSNRPTHSLLISLRVLSSLYGYFDLGNWHIGDTICSRLQQDLPNLSDETLNLHLEIGYLSLSWNLKKVNSLAVDEMDVKDLCVRLKENLNVFLCTSFKLVQNNSNISVTADAFAFSCDLLVLFGDHLLQNTNQSICSLHYQSTIVEYKLFDKFVMQNVFENFADAAAEVDFDEMQLKRRILSSYCKLVSLNLMPIMRACVIFQHYHRFHETFGDILNATMERALDINVIHYGMTILHTCLLVYKDIKAAYDGATSRMTQSTEFSELIQLARRLAETFNSKLLKNRFGVVTLHRGGIMFVSQNVPNQQPTAAYDNLTFLHILEEFVPQLLSQDKFEMLDYLECSIEEPALPSCKQEDWQPLTSYRMTLEMALKRSCRRRQLNERMNYGPT